MAAADGRVDPSERVRLDRFAAHDDISSSELDRIIGGALEGELQTAEPANPQEARDWLAAIARIGLSDGNVDRREIQLLQLLGSKANLSEYDTQLLLKRVRAEQYAAARSQVRF